MKKRIPVLLLVFVGLALIAVMISLTSSKHPAGSSTPDAQGNPKPASSSTGDANGNPSPRSQGDSSAGLHNDAKPAPTEAYSSRVTGEIRAGETLVFGGYLLPNGSHEFTFMTPSAVTQEDGTQAIRLETKTMAMGPELTRQTGLDSIASQEPNNDQRAEAWSMEDMRSSLMKLSEPSEKRSRLMTSPSVIALPGRDTLIHIGSQVGGPSYSLSTKVSLTDQGGFAIDSLVQRVPAGQH